MATDMTKVVVPLRGVRNGAVEQNTMLDILDEFRSRVIRGEVEGLVLCAATGSLPSTGKAYGTCIRWAGLMPPDALWMLKEAEEALLDRSLRKKS